MNSRDLQENGIMYDCRFSAYRAESKASSPVECVKNLKKRLNVFYNNLNPEEWNNLIKIDNIICKGRTFHVNSFGKLTNEFKYNDKGSKGDNGVIYDDGLLCLCGHYIKRVFTVVSKKDPNIRLIIGSDCILRFTTGFLSIIKDLESDLKYFYKEENKKIKLIKKNLEQLMKNKISKNEAKQLRISNKIKNNRISVIEELNRKFLKQRTLEEFEDINKIVSSNYRKCLNCENYLLKNSNKFLCINCYCKTKNYKLKKENYHTNDQIINRLIFLKNIITKL